MNWEEQVEIKISNLIREHQLAHEKFTEQQLAKCIAQALLAGDFIKHVREDGAQGICYVPYVECERARAEAHGLRRFIDDHFIFACDVCGRVEQYFSEWGVSEGTSCQLRDGGRMFWKMKPRDVPKPL